ncbi:MAG TPA: hypothetical protein VEH04_15195 [Verrucomicrobiae bacterium]|nr:hypothetical protein [Verrucomicrobiae bacterium]
MPKQHYQSSVDGSQAVILFETPTARDALLKGSPCHMADLSEESVWAALPSVKDAEAEKTMRNALAAGTVIVAASANGDFPTDFKLWLERWSNKRSTPGTLIAFFYDRKVTDLASVKELYLRQASQSAGMEFKRDMPLRFAAPVPDSIDTFSHRAGQMTSVLDGILSHRSTHTPPL